MSDDTPTTEEVIEALEHNGLIHRANYGIVRLQRADLMRWLERQREEAFQDGRIEERDRARAEQGEPEGRRWFSAAYRAQSGHVVPIDVPSTLQWAAERVRDEYRREDPEGPDYFLASRILPPWLPVEENRPETMTACCTTSEPCEKHWGARHQEVPESTDGVSDGIR